jgi:hypothetical protein
MAPFALLGRTVWGSALLQYCGFSVVKTLDYFLTQTVQEEKKSAR